MLLFQESGYAASADHYVENTLTAVRYVATSYTLASASLTGLGKSTQLALGAYAGFTPRTCFAENQTSRPYSAAGLKKSTVLFFGLHQAGRIILIPQHYVASGYTLASSTLTGLGKSTQLSLGQYAGLTPESDIRRAGVDGRFTLAGASTLTFAPTIANTFVIVGAESLAFTPVSAVATFTVAGSTVISVTGQSSPQFTVAGSTTFTLLGQTQNTAYISGSTILTFYPSGGELEPNISGSGIPGASPAGNAVH